MTVLPSLRLARHRARILAAAAPLAVALSASRLRAAPPQNPAAAPPPAPTIAAKTAGMEKRDGFVPVYLDRKTGKILLEIPADSFRFLWFASEATGLGSNPIGLDRGADGPQQVARFDRAGDHVVLVFENWNYRSSGTADNQRTVAEAFPPSTVASLPLAAEENGKLLVDATDCLVRDWIGVAQTLQQTRQGTYAVARDRSGMYWPYTTAYPENTELDVSLTFAAAGAPGGIVSQIVPDGQAFTIRQHISLVKLPDGGYRPRALDPRVGFFGIEFKDYGQPIQLPLEQRWIGRHRLERVNPADPRSPIRDPMVYYIDRGIPEPIRTAMVQGAKFWEAVFAQAGLAGGFVVKDLPDGADPLDARYNVVQWENRNERGWSVGGSLGDPRTGEIIKGMARLDSHRARTDYNLYAGLMGAAASSADTAFVLARVRQVTAHEIGHTLGMAHNYIASTYERASVMDYPPPRVFLDARGNIDLRQAYAPGPGPYDVWAIHWAYGIFPPGSEQDSLRAIIADGLKKGYLFLSDADARPDFASDPRTNLWDDVSATEFLKRQMDVRRVAISRFGLRNIRPGEPVAVLQERFAPLYFFHRFALSAVTRTIGGMEYANAVAGDGQQETRPIDGDRQRQALGMLLAALQPGELEIPDTVLTLLGPRPFGTGGSVELFRSRTRPAFDELGAARTLAQMIVDGLFQPDRDARLVQFAAGGTRPLTLSAMIDSVVAATWDHPVPGTARFAALQRVAQRAVADGLLALAANDDAAPDVRAMADYKIGLLRREASRKSQAGTPESVAHWQAIAGDLTRWVERRELPKPTPALVAPPGDPFGEPEG
jgi:hypothetical protein